MKNKHHDVLVAWAEGRPIQYKYPANSWITIETEKLNIMDFGRHAELEWRVKPELPWYRVALYGCVNGDSLIFVTGDTEEEADMEKEEYFVRWLTDRISYEV